MLSDGRTALAVLRSTPVRGGDTVLIDAAAGGVGSLLVQLRARAGARVIALAHGPTKTAAAHRMGAFAAVDYSDHGWSDPLHDEIDYADVAFDGVGGHIGIEVSRLLRPGGTVHTFGAAGGAPIDASHRSDLTVTTGWRWPPANSPPCLGTHSNSPPTAGAPH